MALGGLMRTEGLGKGLGGLEVRLSEMRCRSSRMPGSVLSGFMMTLTGMCSAS